MMYRGRNESRAGKQLIKRNVSAMAAWLKAKDEASVLIDPPVAAASLIGEAELTRSRYRKYFELL